ncbi:MAG: AMP-binding protein [Chloroflexi bacterium]|nr:MAG: AMP-binding protein [Chloroflexota bacterium]
MALKKSYVSGGAASPLSGQTIGEYLSSVIARQPDAEALVSRHQEMRLTYGELGREVERVARGLLGLGIEKGDRVGIWSPTRVEWTLLQFATARAGAILVNINPAYRAGEMAYAVNQSGLRLLVTAPAFKTSDYRARIHEVRSQLPRLERVVVLGDQGTGVPGDLLWDDLLAAGVNVKADDVELRETLLDADDPINIQYTSGTTGNPKGATLTHHNILNNARSLAELLRYTAADRVCIPVPLYHCFGMGVGNLGCVTSGATMVYPAESFEPLATLEAIAGERCTSIYGVPTMFIAQLEHPRFAEFDLTSLRTGIMAGAPCPIEVMKRVINEMHASEVCIAYGMTETAPVSFLTRPEDTFDRRVSTVGTVLPHVEAKIIDPATGLTAPLATPGEVCTRGYLVMQGYWENPDATAEAVDRAGWMHTGDLGTIEAEGYLNIVGRIKDMVIRGGENLYPVEIEEVLFQHPAVASAQVIGVPDERMGEELMAWVVVREVGALTEDELKDFCKDRIAHFKVPRYVKFVDEYPMTVTGKVQKFLMRQMAIEELGLEAAAAVKTA